MADEIRIIAAQNTGNPVLDSLVNLLMAHGELTKDPENVHGWLLKLAAKEPGGIRHPQS